MIEGASKRLAESGGVRAGLRQPATRLIVWTSLFVLLGTGAAVYLHWPALTQYTTYKSDIRQEPHWAAYHGTSFRPDDLLVEYATFNESPLQNLIYYLGTFLVDMVTLTKVLAVVGYGLCAGLFFFLVQRMAGFRTGALAAIFFTFFPDQFDYFAGGFSKAWMIPLLLLCVYLVDQNRLRAFVLFLPLAALAYPMALVLSCATVFAHVLLVEMRAFQLARVRTVVTNIVTSLRYPAAGALLGVSALLVKYASPPARIGTMTPGSVLDIMPEMYRGGLAPYLPTPGVFEEFLSHAEHPFTLASAMVFFFILSRRGGVTWRTSWTALFLASFACYLLSDLLFMRLYIPNRYSRYSMLVLLALWHASNWDRILSLVTDRRLQRLMFVGLIVVAAYSFRDTLRHGKDTADRSLIAPPSLISCARSPRASWWPATLDRWTISQSRHAAPCCATTSSRTPGSPCTTPRFGVAPKIRFGPCMPWTSGPSTDWPRNTV